ncbi:hypothetical protein PO909_001066 [Leuciscus waleckii]
MFDSSESGFNNGTNCWHCIDILCEWLFSLHYWRYGKLGKSAVCRAIRKVYLELKQVLGGFVVFPSHNIICSSGFPNVIGAIDCTHVPIKAPPGPNEGDFVNRKEFHSVNVQNFLDGVSYITNVEAKWPGSVHDSRIFRESHLCTLFERGAYDGILLGDRGYTCRQYSMTPFPDPRAVAMGYNAAIARTRAHIEMTFGQLKGIFQCLKSLRVAPDRACDIIVACAILHNIASIRMERTPAVEVQPDDDLQPVHLDQPSGRAAWDRIVEYHFFFFFFLQTKTFIKLIIKDKTTCLVP